MKGIETEMNMNGSMHERNENELDEWIEWMNDMIETDEWMKCNDISGNDINQ